MATLFQNLAKQFGLPTFGAQPPAFGTKPPPAPTGISGVVPLYRQTRAKTTELIDEPLKRKLLSYGLTEEELEFGESIGVGVGFGAAPLGRLRKIDIPKIKPRALEVPKPLEAPKVSGVTKATTKLEEVKPVEKPPTKFEPAKPAEKIERGFITSTREAVPEIKVSGQYIPRGTDKLAVQARNLIRDDIATAERIALTGSDDVAVATSSELIKHYGELAQKSTGAARIAFFDKAADIAVEIAPKLTEQGRAVQAASILGRQTPEGMVRFAAKTISKYNEETAITRGGLFGLRKKVADLSGKQAEEILTEAKTIQNMADGIEKAIALRRLQDKLAKLVPSSWYKKLINIWKAGLLTGIKTSGLNTLSNLFHGTSEIIKDIPAVAVDSVASLFTGKRTLAFTARGGGGLIEGFRKGMRYLKTGFDERDIAIKLDWKKINYGKGKVAKVIQTYENFVFRFIGAQDQPFFYGAKARSIISQGIAAAKNAKLSGKQAQAFVQKFVENPTDDVLRAATNDAEIAVFQNRTLLGDVAKGIQKIPGGEIIVPFGRTPSAVAMQIINYSPVGVVKTIVQNVGKGRFNQRAFSQGIGRGITGSGAIYIGMEMYKQDLISLDYPTSERERNQWNLEGRKPNSIKTPDGKWRIKAQPGEVGALYELQRKRTFLGISWYSTALITSEGCNAVVRPIGLQLLLAVLLSSL